MARFSAQRLVALGLGGWAFVCAPSALADVTYQYDSGFMNTAVGPPSSFPQDPTTGWGNYYDVAPGGETITSLSVAMGPSFAAGRPITLYLFADFDNDFDPRNATLLTSVSGVPAVLGGSVMNTFAITPTLVSSSFFVLVGADTDRGVDKPAAQSTGAGLVQNRSWLFYNPRTIGLNTANLGANALARRTDDGILPFRGPWMVRANGTAVPGPGAAAISVLGGLLACRRRRSYHRA